MNSTGTITTSVSGSAQTTVISPTVTLPISNPSAPAVNAIRSEVFSKMQTWTLIDDCIAGESAVKGKGQQYLPMPNATDTSPENQSRYNAYKMRAVFYAATGRTLRGLVGQAMSKDPTVEMPTNMGKWKNNVDGRGSTATQFAKELVREVLAKGRAGLMADFPAKTDGTPVTVADVDNGIMPFFRFYRAPQIINWRTGVVNGVKATIMVILQDSEEVPNGEFGSVILTTYRCLTLENWNVPGANVFVRARLFRLETNGNFIVVSDVNMADADGKPLKTIPFVFLGSEDNTPDVGPSPMEDIAYINLSHYRDSADAQESAFLVGQPTPVLTGLTKEWVKDVLKGQLSFGSRTAIFLPENSTAELLQATENNLPTQLMTKKEQQMISLGARLIQDKTVNRTATEYSLETNADLSVLGTVVHNINSGLAQLVPVLINFLSTNATDADGDNDFCFELNADFDLARMDSLERQQLIAEWQAGAIDFEEMRAALKQSGIAYKDDDEVKENVENEMDHTPQIDPLTGLPKAAPGQKFGKPGATPPAKPGQQNDNPNDE